MLEIILAVLAGLLVGFSIGIRMRSKPTTVDVQKYMAAAVNREEAAELRRKNRLAVARSGRRTMRTDGGPKAKVHKMRSRKATNNTTW